MSGGKVFLASAVVAGVWLAHGGNMPGHHHGGGLPFSLDSVPFGRSYTQASWARAFLRSAGEPVSRCNVAFAEAWENAEGGHWRNTARYNPLNTTQKEPGSYAINSIGVQAYTSWHEGLTASAVTIHYGYYRGIVAALNAGNDAQRAANAVGASPWGTGYFTAAC